MFHNANSLSQFTAAAKSLKLGWIIDPPVRRYHGMRLRDSRSAKRFLPEEMYLAEIFSNE